MPVCKVKIATLDGPIAAFDLQTVALRSPDFFHTQQSVSRSWVCGLSLLLRFQPHVSVCVYAQPSVCVCALTPLCEFLLRWRMVSHCAAPVWPWNKARADRLQRDAARFEKTKIASVQRRSEASLGWQSLKQGLPGWGSWLTIFGSRTCWYQGLMTEAALVRYRECHLS